MAKALSVNASSANGISFTLLFVRFRYIATNVFIKMLLSPDLVERFCVEIPLQKIGYLTNDICYKCNN